MRTTRSGPPATIVCPSGSTASAYTDALGPAASGGLSVMSGAAPRAGAGAYDVDVDEDKGEVDREEEETAAAAVVVVERERSQSLMVRSKEPETMYFCSRLRGEVVNARGRRATAAGGWRGRRDGRTSGRDSARSRGACRP